eukprot:Sspe_Gene.985::Locus_332_Transcript_1_2_Confidence_0.500_Length_1482::g.985::m.985
MEIGKGEHKETPVRFCVSFSSSVRRKGEEGVDPGLRRRRGSGRGCRALRPPGAGTRGLPAVAARVPPRAQLRGGSFGVAARGAVRSTDLARTGLGARGGVGMQEGRSEPPHPVPKVAEAPVDGYLVGQATILRGIEVPGELRGSWVGDVDDLHPAVPPRHVEGVAGHRNLVDVVARHVWAEAPSQRGGARRDVVHPQEPGDLDRVQHVAIDHHSPGVEPGQLRNHLGLGRVRNIDHRDLPRPRHVRRVPPELQPEGGHLDARELVKGDLREEGDPFRPHHPQDLTVRPGLGARHPPDLHLLRRRRVAHVPHHHSLSTHPVQHRPVLGKAEYSSPGGDTHRDVRLLGFLVSKISKRCTGLSFPSGL